MSSRAVVRISFLAALPLVACVLLVNPESGGAQCQFAGAASDCGTCIAQQCQPQIDACCLDSTCNDVISLVESCTTKHAGACAELRLRSVSSDSGEASLASCVAKSCPSVCIDFTGASTTSCQDLAFGAAACSCSAPSAGSPANEVACSETIYPADLCCASPGWPGATATCECLPLVCFATSDGCMCNLSDFSADASTASCALEAGQCCATADSCNCRVSGCENGETPVSSCTISAIGCVAPTKRVSSCSMRTP